MYPTPLVLPHISQGLDGAHYDLTQEGYKRFPALFSVPSPPLSVVTRLITSPVALHMTFKSSDSTSTTAGGSDEKSVQVFIIDTINKHVSKSHR